MQNHRPKKSVLSEMHLNDKKITIGKHKITKKLRETKFSTPS
jgi:hypothetical protein